MVPSDIEIILWQLEASFYTMLIGFEAGLGVMAAKKVHTEFVLAANLFQTIAYGYYLLDNPDVMRNPVSYIPVAAAAAIQYTSYKVASWNPGQNNS